MSSIIKTTPQTMIKAGSENEKWKAGGGGGIRTTKCFIRNFR